MTDQVTIQDVWCTSAGAHLFNGLTAMHLVHVDGPRVYFSQRKAIVERFIGMLLEGGLIPADMTQRIVPNGDGMP